MALSLAARARLQATLALIGALVLWWWIGGIGWAMVAGATGSFALMAWVSPPHFAPIQRALDRVLSALFGRLTWFRSRQVGLNERPDPAARAEGRTTPPANAGRSDRPLGS